MHPCFTRTTLFQLLQHFLPGAVVQVPHLLVIAARHVVFEAPLMACIVRIVRMVLP